MCCNSFPKHRNMLIKSPLHFRNECYSQSLHSNVNLRTDTRILHQALSSWSRPWSDVYTVWPRHCSAPWLHRPTSILALSKSEYLVRPHRSISISRGERKPSVWRILCIRPEEGRAKPSQSNSKLLSCGHWMVGQQYDDNCSCWGR